MKRGFTSKYGVVCAISAVTREVLDVYFMSKVCSTCEQAKQHEMMEEEKQEWVADHAGDCECNYSGSSPGMEAHGAVILWERSVAKRKLRYTTMVSDGDSKAYSSITSSNPYGDEYHVEKLDCMGHIQKRMGKALLDLKSQPKETSQTERLSVVVVVSRLKRLSSFKSSTAEPFAITCMTLIV